MQKSKRDVKRTPWNASLVPGSEAVLHGGMGESDTVHTLKVGINGFPIYWKGIQDS